MYDPFDDYYNYNETVSKLYRWLWIYPILGIIGYAFLTGLTEHINFPKQFMMVFLLREFWSHSFPILHNFLSGWGLIIYFVARGGLKSKNSKLTVIQYGVEAIVLWFLI